MKNKRFMNTLFSLKSLLAALFLVFVAHSRGQVTIGSDISPTRAALLELKNQQTTGAVSSVSDPANVTSTEGGFLLPRVKLVTTITLEPFIAANDEDFLQNTNSLKQKLAGLMVYNITNDGTLYPAVYTWNGDYWVTSQANEAVAVSIASHPKAFTFYETGEETVEPLTFIVNGSGLVTWTYQWYQVTGNNVHVRIGTPVGQTGTIYTTPATAEAQGSKTAAFTPQAALKGTTRSGSNNGFYKFYCVAESSQGVKLTSNMAEVAVGCGAKNNDGEWFSFMCFNLGAQNGITIQQQKDYLIVNNGGGYTYTPGDENLWGGLFQWGRIADGHEFRDPSNIANYGTLATSDIGNGKRCTSTGNYRPVNQIKKTSTTWYGKYIYGDVSRWTPVNPVGLWLTSYNTSNDPCTHYNIDGTYLEFWHEGTDGTSNSAACGSPSSWRIPSQEEWGAIYKVGMISGSPTAATANTWTWHNVGNLNCGFEIKPDGETTTLYLPAGGYRSPYGGGLGFTSPIGHYWSSSISGQSSYYLYFYGSTVQPANELSPAYGQSLRCIKNT
jgi:uncharacterized protein (TIGR02145 family)